MSHDWTNFCEVRVEQARVNTWVRKSLRTLLKDQATAFFAHHDLPWDVAGPGQAVDVPVPKASGAQAIRSGKTACVHLGVLDPPFQPGCGCNYRTYQCNEFSCLVTVGKTDKHRTCQGCEEYEPKS
jgi:hypothetical protein